MIECLLCGLLKPHKSRYLCLACYQKPESKSLKINVKFRVDREDKSDALRHPTKLPSKPTNHRPGSPEKIEVLKKRWERNELFWHPDDAGFVTNQMIIPNKEKNNIDFD